MKTRVPSSSPAASSSLLLRKAHLSPHYIVTLFAFIVFITVLYFEDFGYIFNRLDVFDQHIERTHPKKQVKLPFSVGQNAEECNVFDGRWVWDAENRPLYEESECPYIQPQQACLEHGRPEKDYQYWRWQPHGCSLPSFNATLMLETLRGKRMMFVGDSLNRGQYFSMVCLLHKLIPEEAKSMETNGSLIIFRAKDYNATIEFYWAPMLLESNADNELVHKVAGDRIARRGSINKHGRHWKGVDIMVFNTYIWWVTKFKLKILQGSFDDEVKDLVEPSTEDAYRMAMNSMLGWVEKNMDPKKTRVFFTSSHHSIRRAWTGEVNPVAIATTKQP